MPHSINPRVTTAVLLAAGTGSRLQPLTNDAPKCLTEVNGTSILERLVYSLHQNGFKRLIVVVGYLDHRIRESLDQWAGQLEIEYVVNPIYSTTNNLYSLWLARTKINAPFLLVESDVVFDAKLLTEMLGPDRIATSHVEQWMEGTTVTIDPVHQVSAFQIGTVDAPGETCHKTVNMYSFTLASWHDVTERLTQHVAAGRVNEYYETVFAEMIEDGSLGLEAVDFDSTCWYEIDTLADLGEAEKMFPSKSLAGDLSSHGTRNAMALLGQEPVDRLRTMANDPCIS
jgi:choline kinase